MSVKMKHKKLTKATAAKLIAENIAPRIKVESVPSASGPYFVAQTGALEITCTQDKNSMSGRIRLHVADRIGMGRITMYFGPESLERDHVEERAEREDDAQEAIREWMDIYGPERCHKMVDKYWKG